MADATVLLADKSERGQAVLTEILRATDGSLHVEGVKSLRAAAERIERSAIDMVVIELSSIAMEELEAVNRYRVRYPEVSWVVVSLFPDLRSELERYQRWPTAVNGDRATVTRA